MEFLVKQGINPISLNPGSVMKITLKVLEIEIELDR
jgi:pyruvate,water dikinase